MADNPIGVHVQGCTDEGVPVEQQRPVLIGMEDAAGNLEVPNIGAHGGVLTEPAPGAPNTVVDQGQPNAGGSLSWPVVDLQLTRTLSGILHANGSTVSISCSEANQITVQLGQMNSGTVVYEITGDGTNFEACAPYSALFNSSINSSSAGDSPDLLWVSCTGAMTFRVRAAGDLGVDVPITLTASRGISSTKVEGQVSQLAGGFPRDLDPTIAFTGTFSQLGSSPSALYYPAPSFLNPDGNNADWVMERTPSKFNTAFATAAGSTALWTPAAGKKFRLMRYAIEITDNATLAAAGILTVNLLDAAGNIAQTFDCFVPSVALNSNGLIGSTGWQDLGNGILSAAANNVLNINLSAALVTGRVRVRCCGTEE